MAKKGTVAYIVLSSVIFLLVAALAFSAFTIYKKDSFIAEMKSKISANEAAIKEKESVIKEKEEKIAGLEENLTGAEKQKESIEAELNTAKADKAKLEEENAKLKKEIENLKLQRHAEAQAAINAAPFGISAAQQTTPSNEKICYLTFDDGPSEKTLEILDILKAYNIKATFFVINSPNLNYVKRIYDEGHTVGLHCNHHVYSEVYASVDAYFNDLTAISNAVENIIGVKSYVIRFPGGGSNKVSMQYSPGIMTTLTQEVKNRGYSYFDWNVSSGDAEANNVSYTKITNNVLGSVGNKGSICVLFHDASSKGTTVQALPGIIEGLIAKGYTFAPLSTETFGYHHSVNN